MQLGLCGGILLEKGGSEEEKEESRGGEGVNLLLETETVNKAKRDGRWGPPFMREHSLLL